MQIDQKKLTIIVNQASRNIVEAIVRDLTDRMGLGDEWEDIDSEVRKEIRAEWRTISRRFLAEFGRDLLKEIVDPIQDAIGEEIEGVGGPPDGEGL